MARESKRHRDERRFGRPEHLADMVLSWPWGVPYWAGPKLDAEMFVFLRDLRHEVMSDLVAATVVAADNVGEYFYSQNPKEDWEYSKDFPSCVTPFRHMFVEFSRPSRLLSGGRISSAAERFPERWGWLLKTQAREELSTAWGADEAPKKAHASLAQELKRLYPLVDQHAIMAAKHRGPEGFSELGVYERAFVALGGQFMKLDRGENPLDSAPPDFAWAVEGAMLMANHGRVVPLAQCSFPVSKTGQILQRPAFGTIGGANAPREMQEEFLATWSALLLPALLAVSFMNCKNVSVQPRDPDPLLNRERRKHNLQPLLRYHTINIEPMKQVLRTEGNIETNGLARALHICRGHFARYTDSFLGRSLAEPITVWRPAHVRGSAKAGVVLSDYQVQPGEVQS